MPKRSCPFSESFSSQYKVHVGQRELSEHGVLGHKYRQEIYEKTKNLLFNGARAVMGKILNVDGEEKRSDPQPSKQEGTPACSQALLKGQTTIGQDGRLRKAPIAQGQGAPAAPSRCGVCHKGQRTGDGTLCSQCGRQSCGTCSRQCSTCSSFCCSVCSIVDYSSHYDLVLCCGCSS